MSVSKSKAKTNDLVKPMQRAAEKMLAERFIVPLEEFEAFLLKEFEDHWREWVDETIEGSTRTRPKNLIDWVKARLTQETMIQYFVWNGIRHVVWCPMVGIVDGVGPLVTKNSAIHLLRMVEEMTAKPE